MSLIRSVHVLPSELVSIVVDDNNLIDDILYILRRNKYKILYLTFEVIVSSDSYNKIFDNISMSIFELSLYNTSISSIIINNFTNLTTLILNRVDVSFEGIVLPMLKYLTLNIIECNYTIDNILNRFSSSLRGLYLFDCKFRNNKISNLYQIETFISIVSTSITEYVIGNCTTLKYLMILEPNISFNPTLCRYINLLSSLEILILITPTILSTISMYVLDNNKVIKHTYFSNNLTLNFNKYFNISHRGIVCIDDNINRITIE